MVDGKEFVYHVVRFQKAYGSRLRTVDSDNAFASLLVVLPSASSTGAMRFSLGGLSVDYTSGPSNLFHTTVVSWLSGVGYSMGPVSGGYQLALSYKLIHSDVISPKPMPSTNIVLVERLRHILQFWAQDHGQSTPDKVLYLLEDTYGTDSLSLGILQGADAEKCRVFYSLAKEYGFHLGLANVDCHLCGYADDKYQALEEKHQRERQERQEEKEEQRESRWDDYYSDCDEPPSEVSSDSEESDEEQDVEFGDVDNREATVDRFVDIHGQWISGALDYDDEEEAIPEDLCEDAEGDDHYKQGYIGFRDVCI